MKIALLLATDNWDKLDVYQAHLEKHPDVAWAFGGNYSREYLEQFPYPIHLYFFHRSTIRYRAVCIGIYRTSDRRWSEDDIPAEFRSDVAPYEVYAEITHLERVVDTHIGDFPKWEDPDTFFSRGQQGLLRVQDILPGRV